MREAGCDGRFIMDSQLGYFCCWRCFFVVVVPVCCVFYFINMEQPSRKCFWDAHQGRSTKPEKSLLQVLFCACRNRAFMTWPLYEPISAINLIQKPIILRACTSLAPEALLWINQDEKYLRLQQQRQPGRQPGRQQRRAIIICNLNKFVFAQ